MNFNEQAARITHPHHRPGVYSSSLFDRSGARRERPKQRLFILIALAVCLLAGGCSSTSCGSEPSFPAEEVWW